MTRSAQTFRASLLASAATTKLYGRCRSSRSILEASSKLLNVQSRGMEIPVAFHMAESSTKCNTDLLN